MNKKLEDMIAESKLKEILHKNEAEKQKNAVVWVLAIIGADAYLCEKKDGQRRDPV